jgi:hypothetical protein
MKEELIKELELEAPNGLELIGKAEISEGVQWEYYIDPANMVNIHVFESVRGGQYQRGPLYRLEGFLPPIGFEPSPRYETLVMAQVCWPVCHGWERLLIEITIQKQQAERIFSETVEKDSYTGGFSAGTINSLTHAIETVKKYSDLTGNK